MEERIRSSCEYFSFPAVRKKKTLCFVLLSGCNILCCFPSILSYPILKAVAISHKYSCGRLLAHWGLPLWASSSSSIFRASPLQSHSLLRRVSSGFSGLVLFAWELVMLHCSVNSTLSAFHSLWSKPHHPDVSLHSCTLRRFPSFELLEGKRTCQVQ